MKNWKSACVTWSKQNRNNKQNNIPSWYKEYKEGLNNKDSDTGYTEWKNEYVSETNDYLKLNYSKR